MGDFCLCGKNPSWRIALRDPVRKPTRFPGARSLRQAPHDFPRRKIASGVAHNQKGPRRAALRADPVRHIGGIARRVPGP